MVRFYTVGAVLYCPKVPFRGFRGKILKIEILTHTKKTSAENFDTRFFPNEIYLIS